ncbi:hypothetical protein ACW9I8_28105, partial [Pseudomonas reactans]
LASQLLQWAVRARANKRISAHHLKIISGFPLKKNLQRLYSGPSSTWHSSCYSSSQAAHAPLHKNN